MMRIIYPNRKATILKYIFLILITLVSVNFIVKAAYLNYVPQKITQPNGEVINCFASGDEFFNWLHDKDGYTIIQRPDNGYYVYADKLNGDLIPTSYIVGKNNPSTLGLAKWLKLSPEKIMERVKQYNRFPQVPEVKTKGNKTQSLNIGTINNIVIFIRFSDESEYTDPISEYNGLFNDAGTNSLKSFYQEASYGELDVNTTFYPPASSTVISYQDTHQRAYYEPYNAVTNTIGY